MAGASGVWRAYHAIVLNRHQVVSVSSSVVGLAVKDIRALCAGYRWLVYSNHSWLVYVIAHGLHPDHSRAGGGHSIFRLLTFRESFHGIFRPGCCFGMLHLSYFRNFNSW